ncbi:hypothetical protein [Paenarthrobacter nitroguajacolicus]|uniref:nSTAND3 domain-containing NTPase n=1 Tax=Paenarthrobacter nitroguajacolicus TaxID=211146 RepID=UPI00285E529B|nr:hypothetical protein [Paenarthrobacter nitroguajacolicus]MDR6636962.1 energy-coupling factor transporter ATP-binding protein EcfA2 [Paenarthrobacter nitroguajacolicus]
MAESLSYDLHKLGWRAFQDLSAVILQTVFGQTFHTFADSNDGGRDGAFHTGWTTTRPDESSGIPANFATGPVVAQCKFSASGAGTLSPHGLKDELAKVQRLQEQGLCDGYILMTNLRVTGETEAWLIDELQQRGVSQVLSLDGTWICQQISTRPLLRRYVPRVYGLGDLSQILDERRLEQSSVLLANLGEDLATFVPTAAYRQAADALAEHGFTLLLGAPAAGKSTIAAVLSAVALDEQGAGVRRVDSASELIQSWNPHEKGQLFWVDDAFGAIRYDQQLTDQWSRRLDQIMTAVKSGAKVILTSRDYIYQQARTHLKEYAYPLLREQRVVVDVAQLSKEERRQILYNHLRAGDQPAKLLRQWRPQLPAVAASSAFQPEIARRLGRQAFTKEVTTSNQILDYVERPVDFLKDVIAQLDPAARAALACVYLSGYGLPIPLDLSAQLTETVSRLGATVHEVIPAFSHLNQNFLSAVTDASGAQHWRFRHPTLREGFAATIADDPNAVEILVKGLTDDELVGQVDCGGSQAGTLLSVPPSLYQIVAARTTMSLAIGSDWYSPLAQFLTRRCSDDFLRLWAAMHTRGLPSLLNFTHLMGSSWRPVLLARLRLAEALPENLRRSAVDLLETRAIEDFDGTWLDSDIVGLFTESERTTLLESVINQVLPDIDDFIYRSADGFDSDVPAAARYEQAENTVTAYINALSEDPEVSGVLRAAQRMIAQRVADAEEDFSPPRSHSFTPYVHTETPPSDRDQFDDVHVGH